MCFARTFCNYEELARSIRRNMNDFTYTRGCMFISIVASRALERAGIAAVPELVAMWKAATQEWIPPFVVIRDGELVDFKHRTFGVPYTTEKTVEAGTEVTRHIKFTSADIVSSPQEEGWFPEGRVYKRDVQLSDFSSSRAKKTYLQFLTTNTSEEFAIVTETETKMYRQ